MVTKKTCFKCRKKPETDLLHLRPLCKDCFCTTIEKRIRKYTRINKIFRKNDRILTIDNLDYHLIKSIIKNLPVRIFLKKFEINYYGKKDKKLSEYINKNKINKIIIPWTLDDEVNCSLENIINNKKTKKNNKFSSIIINASEKELKLFCKFKKIKHNFYPKKQEIRDMLDKLEERYAETKFSLLRSFEEIKKSLS